MAASVPKRMERPSILALLSSGASDQSVNIGGRVVHITLLGNVAYVEIEDGSCLKTLRLHIYSASVALPNLPEPGSSLQVVGKLNVTPNGKMVLEVESVVFVGLADGVKYPLLEKKRKYNAKIAMVDRIRSELNFATQTFFRDHGFIFVNTPVITTSHCEGAGGLLQVTTLIGNLESELVTRFPVNDGKIDFSSDYFGRQAFLSCSGQLHLEAYACSLSNVYTFGPTFPGEKSHTSAESWMVQSEFAFADLEDCMNFAETYLKFLCAWLLENCYADMEFLAKEKRVETKEKRVKTLIECVQNVASSTFERITYKKAINLLKKSTVKFTNKVKSGIELASEHERYLTDKYGKPVIVYDFPERMKAFNMRVNEVKTEGETAAENKVPTTVVAAMDVLVPKVGKLIGGGQREERLDELVKRITEMGLPLDSYEWYLDLRRHGTVSHCGFELVFETMLLFATGMDNINDVIRFPRLSRDDPSIIPSHLSLPIIKNQLRNPYCLLFAAIAWYEGMHSFQKKGQISLSSQQWIDGFTPVTDGASFNEFLGYLEKFPYVTTAKNYPSARNHKRQQFDLSKAKKNPQVGYKWVHVERENSENYAEAMMKAVKNGPLLGRISTGSEFAKHREGTLSSHDEGELVPHAIVIHDYGTDLSGDYWLIQNSHGKKWGVDGVGRIVRGRNYCGIERIAFYLVPLAGSKKKSNVKKSFKDKGSHSSVPEAQETFGYCIEAM